MAKQQTYSDMRDAGATHAEAMKALALFEILRPCLKIKSNGRVRTIHGDKLPLGLYRLIKEQILNVTEKELT